MNRTQWYQHWHNIRAMTRPRNYGNTLVKALRFAGEPAGEVAYGYVWGAMSIMQQPVTQRRVCPICGTLRSTGVYGYITDGNKPIRTCEVCNPPAGLCPSCTARCSNKELRDNAGFCEYCVPREEETDDFT